MLQNWSLTIIYSLVSYPRHPLWSWFFHGPFLNPAVHECESLFIPLSMKLIICSQFIFTFFYCCFLGGFLTVIYQVFLSNTNFAQLAASLQRGKAPTNKCPGYDTKQSDNEARLTLELWRMQSTCSLPSLPGQPWPGVVAADRVLCIGQIEQNFVHMLNLIAWNTTLLTFNCG